MSSSGTKYDMRFNLPYQIDCVSASSGKHLAATKRQATFRFGYSNREALEKGATGTEARGEEHEVRLVWSLASGKRAISFDGKEVHFSVGRRGDNRFDFSWPIQGGHILKIVAYATAALRSSHEFKQFELFLDGMSFFQLPRIYELGGPSGARVARAVDPSDHGFAYTNSRQVEVGRRANDDGPNHVIRGGSVHNHCDGMRQGAAAVATSPPRSTTSPNPTNNATATAPAAPVQDILSHPPQVFIPAAQPAAHCTDEFAPVQHHFAPPRPTFQDVSNKILSAYEPSPSTTKSHAHALVPHHQPFYAEQAHNLYQTYSPQPAMVSPQVGSYNGGFHVQPQPPTPPQPQGDDSAFKAPVVTPTKMTMMTPLEVDELRDSPPPANAMDLAVQNLVNLDDLNLSRSSPEQLKAKKQKENQKAESLKSRPKAPVATDWRVGAGASLADIKQNKKAVAPIAKEIMKVHAFDPAAAQAGMMVLYGQQQPAGGVPPSVEFGMGRGVYHQGFNQPVRSSYKY